MVSTSSADKNMDKSSVLKATTDFIKAHSEPINPPKESETRKDWKPSILSDEEFSYLLLEALDGFIIVISETGKILYVSESVASLLGHLPIEMVNCSIYEYISPQERDELVHILNYYPDMETKLEYSLTLNMRLGNLELHGIKDKFQMVKLHGHYKRFVPNSDTGAVYADDVKFVFVGIGRLLESDLLREMSTVVEALNMEFASKKSMQWKYIFLDDRAQPIIGYTPFELLGTSGYDLVHVEDLDKLAASHERLMVEGHGNSCFYRFLTKGQQWIWLQSRYQIITNHLTLKPECVDCIHRVVSYSEVMRDLRNDSGSGPSSSAGFRSQAPEGPVQPHVATEGDSTGTNPSEIANSNTKKLMNQFDSRLAMYHMDSQIFNINNHSQPLPVAAFYMNPVTTPSGATLAGYSSGILLTPEFRDQLRLADSGHFGNSQSQTSYAYGPVPPFHSGNNHTEVRASASGSGSNLIDHVHHLNMPNPYSQIQSGSGVWNTF